MISGGPVLGAGTWRLMAAAGFCGVLAASVALGAMTVSTGRTALLVGGFIAAAGLLATDPLLVAVAAFPATLLIQRAGNGGAGSSITLADLVLLLAALVSLTKVRWRSARFLQLGIVPAAVYEALMALTVVAHPNVHDSLEWAHRLEMLVGALVVGWAVAASGRARQAVSALLLGDIVLVVLAVEHSVALNFLPAQWGLYQKNYIGSVLWVGAVIAHLNPSWIGVHPRLARWAKYLCVLGILASQSKQAIIALFCAVILAILLDPAIRRRSRFFLAALGPVLIAGYFILVAGLAHPSQFTTAGFRLTSFSADLQVWHLDTLFGQGMRWFYLPGFSHYAQPPDIFFETVTDGGVVGLIAFIVLVAGATRVFLKLPRGVGTLAIVLVVGRVIEGIFDNYWVSSGTTLPWMIAGLALGAWDAHLSRSQIVLPRETPYLPHHMATMVRLPHGLSRPAGPDD